MLVNINLGFPFHSSEAIAHKNALRVFNLYAIATLWCSDERGHEKAKQNVFSTWIVGNYQV